jgi:hypothetical protein
LNLENIVMVVLLLVLAIAPTQVIGSEDCTSYRGPECLSDKNLEKLSKDQTYQDECIDQIEAVIRTLENKDRVCLDGVSPDYGAVESAYFGALPGNLYDNFCEAIDDFAICEKISKRLTEYYFRTFVPNYSN